MQLLSKSPAWIGQDRIDPASLIKAEENCGNGDKAPTVFINPRSLLIAYSTRDDSYHSLDFQVIAEVS